MKQKHIGKGITRLYSETLGEYIYFVSDSLPLERISKLSGVAYTYSERHLLRGVSREQLKMIHLAKKLFNGEILDFKKIKGFPPGEDEHD